MLSKMKLQFYKYQGAGNDFIIIDNRTLCFPLENRLDIIQRLCSRKFGIGSDGLMLLQNDEECDFYLEFYNPDGSQSFCGNGSRCIVMFAKHIGILDVGGSFKSIHGINQAVIMDPENVKLDMFDVSNIEIGEGYHFMDTGSPHYNINANENLEDIDLVDIAHGVRYSDRFKDFGTNVNVIQELEKGIKIRTYERGVEGETYACGTGATACAISYALIHGNESISEVNVSTKGGDLIIQFEKNNDSFVNVKLIGPAKFVFKGEVDV